MANYARGMLSFAGGGRWNSVGENIYDTCAIVVGGESNTVSGGFGSVGGGSWNNVDSAYGVIPGGNSNSVGGRYGFAAGYASYVMSGHTGSAAFNGQSTTASGQLRCGSLSKAGGTFTIDHPLDPDNKILNHYFVESPEMVNVYRGEAFIGPDGRTTVYLPEYFDALNKDPMVQLTGIGSSDVYLAERVKGNQFVIGGKPGIDVYWIVTGARKDQSAEIIADLMPVEQVKTGGLAGHSLDDDFLASTLDQLKSLGRAGGYRFRTAGGQEKYDKMPGRGK